MNNNDVLRRLRYALDIKDTDMISIFEMGGIEITKDEYMPLLKKEEQAGYVECTDEQLEKFLDGFITFKRGPRE